MSIQQVAEVLALLRRIDEWAREQKNGRTGERVNPLPWGLQVALDEQLTLVSDVLDGMESER